MRNVKDDLRSRARIEEKIGDIEFEIERSAGILFEDHVPVHLCHRVALIEWRRVDIQDLCRFETDLLKERLSLRNCFAKFLIVLATHHAIRIRGHERVSELRSDDVGIEPVRPLFILAEELLDLGHNVPLQIPSPSLLFLDRNKQRLEVSLTKPLASLSLQDLIENCRSILDRLCEDLQQVTLVIAVDENAETF